MLGVRATMEMMTLRKSAKVESQQVRIKSALTRPHMCFMNPNTSCQLSLPNPYTTPVGCMWLVNIPRCRIKHTLDMWGVGSNIMLGVMQCMEAGCPRSQLDSFLKVQVR